MSRLVLDSVSYQALAATRWPHLIGYVNGRISAWTADEIQRTRAAGQLLGLVDVLGTMPREASILDFERGDVQSPAVVREWARARNSMAGDATVYCSPKSIATVVSGLRGEPLNLWVVDLTGDGEPPFTVPHYPGLPGNVRVIARQFVFGPRSGGDYDMSVFYRDEWHPEQLAPAHLFAARAAAAAELGPYQNASAAAELTNPDTGEVASAPLEVRTLPEPFGATLPCAWCPKPVTCATAGRCLEPNGAAAALAAAASVPAPSSSTAAPVDQAAAAVDQAAAELAGAALVASTAPSSPAPAADVDQAAAAPVVYTEDPAALAAAARLGAGIWTTARFSADAAASSAQYCGDTPGGHGWPVCSLPPHGADVDHESADLRWPDGATMPVAKGSASSIVTAASEELDAGRAGSGTAGSVATAAAVGEPDPAQPPLNHDFIRATLADVGEVAKMFRAYGWHRAALELERGAAIAWELGSALKSAGL